MNKNEVLKRMKDFYKNQSLRLPKQMDIHVEGNTCNIMLDAEKVNKENMQEDCNAFEGWSIAVYTALRESNRNLIVKLGIEPDAAPEKPSGHWNRFLYRAGRFCGQYQWFILSKELTGKIREAAEAFKKENIRYYNNVPKKAAGIKTNHNKENEIEAYLSEKDNLKEVINDAGIFDGEEVYRQFPVGLFKDSVKKSNRAFTGGKSAIDLWSYKDDTVYVIELKASNKMVGIITEIFFYANYMYDLLVNEIFTLNSDISQKGEEEDRGYGNLLKQRAAIKKVKGILLSDQYHPILENRKDAILEILNDNGNIDISYDKTDYKLNNMKNIKK